MYVFSSALIMHCSFSSLAKPYTHNIQVHTHVRTRVALEVVRIGRSPLEDWRLEVMLSRPKSRALFAISPRSYSLFHHNSYHLRLLSQFTYLPFSPSLFPLIH